MPALHFTTHINSPANKVFALVADLAHYGQWLPPSGTFKDVMHLSQGPIGLGTTYANVGPSGTMQGTVTEYQPMTSIVFQQTMHTRVLFKGIMDMNIRYSLEPADDGTLVNREVSFHTHGFLKVAQPIIATTIRRESERILQIMKHYLETQTKDEDQ